MTQFDAFNKGYERLELSETDYYCKKIFIELEKIKAERLEEYISGEVPLRSLWPSERDIRDALDQTHRHLKCEIEKFRASMPWASTYAPPEYNPDNTAK